MKMLRMNSKATTTTTKNYNAIFWAVFFLNLKSSYGICTQGNKAMNDDGHRESSTPTSTHITCTNIRT